jgi:Na+/H+ antiporter NhaD/arsenite permease-like protein
VMFSHLIATAAIQSPHPALMVPFALLLISIACAPILLRHHWERYYHVICLVLAAIVSGYYIFVFNAGERVLHAGFEYFSFMVVVGAFFVVSGGIHLRAKGESRPFGNTLFLLGGALLANLISTTGASMVLIRPWIRMNRHRFSGMHLAFFIFIVSNIGGALLPVGPPLLLGFLKGVPFWWGLQRCWAQWSVTLGLLLAVFYIVDLRNYRKAGKIPSEEMALPEIRRWDGFPNFFFLLVILVALIAIPAGWRECVIILVTVGSYLITPARVHDANEFSFTPIKEIGWLFLGIFGTMIPVLDYMELHAGNLGLDSDLEFYWSSGVLSALLDNAPTYLTFLAGAFGLHGLDMNNAQQMTEFISQHDHSLVAISLGATCFGALTYIGNGPNLLVKAISEHAKLPTPSFFGYAFKFAVPVLLPIFAVISVLFFWR